MSATSTLPKDHVHVRFKHQLRHLQPNIVYEMTFGQVHVYRRTYPGLCEPEGPAKDAYLAYEKKQK